jgi:hypothetical protein
MKKVLRSFYIMLKGIGVARAAADLARNGKHEQAKKIITAYGECK